MFQYLSDNFTRLLTLTLGHLLLSLVALVISVLIGVSIGAYVGHLHKYSFLAINLGNVLRALPTLALIAVMIALIGFGFVNITIALVVLALPLILTNAYTAVAGVDRGMVEAARGMGMTDSQILFRVELPNAIPLIMTGVRTAWVYTVATAYLAIFAGYATRPGQIGTLGDIIGNPSGESTPGILVAAAFAIVLAFVGAGLLSLAERAVTPAGIKLARSAAMAPA
ncbi:osmoprotectant transport system permease protein [Pseudonocardia sediminis]|uniref:Osmoprotectant transport system permease protein n=1 Tax=Pseudonocardia sediminis TaxID=1397368 RepID=A0A4Q7UWM3_PSEST|nr:ABC transporter permease [Pseudonocardia sediminis]RZT85291.1 osmoprotectant transport system permease protein [Pseudonocardia sediminis]